MVSSAATAEGQRATRTRLVEAAAALFSRNGYAATGVKAVLADAAAPYGSLYHWFPGGKQELGVAALEHGGERYRQLIESVYPDAKDVAEATADSFVLAAELLEQSDFDYSCPIATIALEVASTDEPMRVAAASAFESWLAVLEQRFAEAGMTAGTARDTAVQIFALLEGSLLLARTTRSTKPVATAGRLAADTVAAALAAETAGDDREGSRKG
ncbi:TetR/AcrR family transcriptional regulator [Pseudonocardia sp. C8]|uniref:TetR/AcrR family transcriptional regulator n=1 Tax=Pseudonocardia sp. C8 TaxID=2762759 RepID=UPI0016433D2D|nr:TetR/AcrR family transcriptional regulator [Pseudonocardia sp. C8]MBC3193756.1 TetR/AcrR family transcriptional regulator [Pseudonocardia sp. C8]